jgi:hypothetical protein
MTTEENKEKESFLKEVQSGKRKLKIEVINIASIKTDEFYWHLPLAKNACYFSPCKEKHGESKEVCLQVFNTNGKCSHWNEEQILGNFLWNGKTENKNMEIRANLLKTCLNFKTKRPEIKFHPSKENCISWDGRTWKAPEKWKGDKVVKLSDLSGYSKILERELYGAEMRAYSSEEGAEGPVIFLHVIPEEKVEEQEEYKGWSDEEPVKKKRKTGSRRVMREEIKVAYWYQIIFTFQLV